MFNQVFIVNLVKTNTTYKTLSQHYTPPFLYTQLISLRVLPRARRLRGFETWFPLAGNALFVTGLIGQVPWPGFGLLRCAFFKRMLGHQKLKNAQEETMSSCDSFKWLPSSVYNFSCCVHGPRQCSVESSCCEEIVLCFAGF